jgi:hypothetical protein
LVFVAVATIWRFGNSRLDINKMPHGPRVNTSLDHICTPEMARGLPAINSFILGLHGKTFWPLETPSVGLSSPARSNLLRVSKRTYGMFHKPGGPQRYMLHAPQMWLCLTLLICVVRRSSTPAWLAPTPC